MSPVIGEIQIKISAMQSCLLGKLCKFLKGKEIANKTMERLMRMENDSVTTKVNLEPVRWLRRYRSFLPSLSPKFDPQNLYRRKRELASAKVFFDLCPCAMAHKCTHTKNK